MYCTFSLCCRLGRDVLLNSGLISSVWFCLSVKNRGTSCIKTHIHTIGSQQKGHPSAFFAKHILKRDQILNTLISYNKTFVRNYVSCFTNIGWIMGWVK